MCLRDRGNYLKYIMTEQEGQEFRGKDGRGSCIYCYFGSLFNAWKVWKSDPPVRRSFRVHHVKSSENILYCYCCELQFISIKHYFPTRLLLMCNLLYQLQSKWKKIFREFFLFFFLFFLHTWLVNNCFLIMYEKCKVDVQDTDEMWLICSSMCTKHSRHIHYSQDNNACSIMCEAHFPLMPYWRY